MPETCFRLALGADAASLADLIERAYRGPASAGSWNSEAHLLKGPRTSHAEVAGLIGREDSHFLMAEADGRLQGCCLLQRLPPGPDARTAARRVYFGMFAIEPDLQGAGLGKAMIREAERQGQMIWDADEMIMTVISLRTELIDWYGRRGYALTGGVSPFPFSDTTGETRRDFHLVELCKRLS